MWWWLTSCGQDFPGMAGISDWVTAWEAVVWLLGGRSEARLSHRYAFTVVSQACCLWSCLASCYTCRALPHWPR